MGNYNFFKNVENFEREVVGLNPGQIPAVINCQSPCPFMKHSTLIERGLEQSVSGLFRTYNEQSLKKLIGIIISDYLEELMQLLYTNVVEEPESYAVTLDELPTPTALCDEFEHPPKSRPSKNI